MGTEIAGIGFNRYGILLLNGGAMLPSVGPEFACVMIVC